MTNSASNARPAFTLIEIMVAVLLLALLASAAALSFTKPLRDARAADALETVRTFDEAARTAARRTGRSAVLRFDLANRVLLREETRDGSKQYTQQLRLPFGFHVSQVRTAARRASEGQADVLCSALGITRTYAVRIDGSNAPTAWLLISGLSGEVTRITDESKLDAIFAATATRAEARAAEADAPPPGDDAH